MDTTRIEELLTKLAEADPAQAPDLADELTAVLAAALDGPATPPDPDPGPVPEGGAS